MITRRRAKMAEQKQASESQSQEFDFEVNNQLGVETYDSITYERSVNVNPREEDHSDRARGHETRETDIMRLFESMMQQQQKSLEKFSEKTLEEQRKSLDKMEEKISKKLTEELGGIKEEFHSRLNNINSDFQEQMKKLEEKIDNVQKTNENAMMEIRKELKKHVKESKEERERDRQEWKKAIANTQNSSKQHIDEIARKVNNLQEAQTDTMEKINSVSIEKGKRLDEITTNLTTVRENQQRVQRRLEEMEMRPAVATNGLNMIKEVTFDGEDCYPMEFLKELREIQSIYYPNDNTRWIGKHLTGEANIWWRINRDQISTFKEFEEGFTEKYWGPLQQEKVRDQLEYGRYNHQGSLNMLQYMERQVLLCRQLIPVMSDRHLITKLARHYNREIQIAVVTRGITTINSFECLLKEYTGIRNRGNGEEQRVDKEKTAIKFKSEPLTSREKSNNEETRRHKQWQGMHQNRQRMEIDKPVINSLTVERQQTKTDVQPGTSRDSSN